ncbi:MAG: DUF6265 family protein [Gemmatimonadota bacterium]|nr:DUF6265 family protein [Gemmatimonadota bacterium]MDH4350142.1 DUF6265 family protein [Gemmatimonadota bacterium]MDH5196566.1 DUF6265 family protein [Gemmatimonadota bacterium]
MSWIAFVVLVGATVSRSAGNPQADLIERVAWLQGCWAAASPQRTIEEQWMAPLGHSMIGMSRTVRDGRLAAHELVVLQEDGGRLAYQAYPSGQQSAVFHSAIVSDTLMIVENPEHDFPQQIGYRPVGPDSLSAWIGGRRNGHTRRIEFGYRRAPCPSR